MEMDWQLESLKLNFGRFKVIYWFFICWKKRRFQFYWEKDNVLFRVFVIFDLQCQVFN